MSGLSLSSSSDTGRKDTLPEHSFITVGEILEFIDVDGKLQITTKCKNNR